MADGSTARSFLDAGRSLVADLVETLLCVRSKPIYLQLDIKIAFFCIKVHEADRGINSLLYRDLRATESAVRIIQFLALCMGNSDSTFLLISCLNEIANRIEPDHK